MAEDDFFKRYFGKSEKDSFVLFPQKQDVEAVLSDLGVKDKVDNGLIEVLNKIDLLSPEEQKQIQNQKGRQENEWPVSALTGEGLDSFLNRIERELMKNEVVMELSIPIERGDILASLYRKGHILKRKDTTRKINLTVSLLPKDYHVYLPYERKKVS